MSGPIAQSLPDPTTLGFHIDRDVEYMWLETPQDAEGTPIVDAALQLPLKPIFTLQAVSVYYIQKFVTAYSDEKWRDENNTLNSATWRSWKRGEAWCSCKPTDGANYNGIDAVLVEYFVRCVRGGWETKIPEAGYAYLSGTDLLDYTTDDGSVTIGKLTEDGDKAAADDELIVTKWDTKRVINFSSFLP